MPALARRLRRPASVGAATVTQPGLDPPTVEIELPTVEISPARRVA
jgi:hypothetical protein